MSLFLEARGENADGDWKLALRQKLLFCSCVFHIVVDMATLFMT
jgi:hypothetical protein